LAACVNARIARFVSFDKYNDDTFVELFKEAGIKVEIKDRPSAQITFLD
jgi:dCMP deaminase